MLKRTPERSPQERRARRIRAAFLTCFALFSVIILFIVAWVGVALQKRNPPRTLVPETSPTATACFHVDQLLASAAQASFAGNESSANQLIEEFRVSGAPLSDQGQAFFWSKGESPPAWLVYVPMERRNAIYVETIRRRLSSSQLIIEIGAEPDETTLAWYQIDGTGLYLSSESVLPEFSYADGVDDCSAQFRLASSQWLPGFVLARLPESLQPAIVEAESLEIEWIHPGEADAEGKVILRTFDENGSADESELPWFHPFVREPEQG